MSSPQASCEQNETTDETPRNEDRPPAPEASETTVETIECLNCGHEFSGNYCPECGQEGNPSVSITDVIGGFFRQFGDLEHGFWRTFWGLTVRPGEVLREYLGGLRKGLMGPGRYLLAALVIDVAADRLLIWVGARIPPWTDAGVSRHLDPTPMDAASDDIFYTAFVEVFTVLSDPQTRFISLLLMAGLLAAVLYRLIAELDRMSEALAVGSFLMAHATFLSRGADLLYTVPAFFYAGQTIETPTLLLVLVSVGYLGFASHRAFGPGWKGAVKGGVAGAWALVLLTSVSGLSVCVYAVGQAVWYPWGWEYLSTGGVLASSIIFALPLLLHAGVELYLRYRG